MNALRAIKTGLPLFLSIDINALWAMHKTKPCEVSFQGKRTKLSSFRLPERQDFYNRRSMTCGE
jgi:hypothetical protein